MQTQTILLLAATTILAATLAILAPLHAPSPAAPSAETIETIETPLEIMVAVGNAAQISSDVSMFGKDCRSAMIFGWSRRAEYCGKFDKAYDAMAVQMKIYADWRGSFGYGRGVRTDGAIPISVMKKILEPSELVDSIHALRSQEAASEY